MRIMTNEERITRLRQALLTLNVLRKFAKELDLPEIREGADELRAKVAVELSEAERLNSCFH